MGPNPAASAGWKRSSSNAESSLGRWGEHPAGTRVCSWLVDARAPKRLRQPARGRAGLRATWRELEAQATVSRWDAQQNQRVGPAQLAKMADFQPRTEKQRAVNRFRSGSRLRLPVRGRFSMPVHGKLSHRPTEVGCGQVAQGEWLEET